MLTDRLEVQYIPSKLSAMYYFVYFFTTNSLSDDTQLLKENNITKTENE